MAQHHGRRYFFALVLVIGSLLALCAGRLPAGRAATTRSTPQTIAAIGDSIVFGFKDEDEQGGWVGRLGQTLGLAYPAQRYAMINAGINGDTSAGVLRRLDRDMNLNANGQVVHTRATVGTDALLPDNSLQR